MLPLRNLVVERQKQELIFWIRPAVFTAGFVVLYR